MQLDTHAFALQAPSGDELSRASHVEVLNAQARLAEALHRLDAMQRAALLGGPYDPDEYDDAVIAYRHARADFDDACGRSARRAYVS
jgi:hypothetical protein